MSKIIFVKTSHIAIESVNNVRNIIEKEKPDCVAVELDYNRYLSLNKKTESNFEIIKSLGFATFLIYFLFKKLQEWLGKKVNILPGSEMLEAIKVAKRKQITVAFIDQDIRTTFSHIQQISLKGKLRLFWFLFKGLFLNFLTKKKEIIDLNKVPEEKLIKTAIKIFKTELFELYSVLISERNKFMTKKLVELSEKFEKIVAVIGAGHFDLENHFKTLKI